MATLAQTTQTLNPSVPAWTLFSPEFMAKAEFNRFGWAATVLMIQGCILTPALLFSMYLFNGGDWQFLIANLTFLLVLVPILSAMPAKVLFRCAGLSYLVQVLIIVVNIL